MAGVTVRVTEDGTLVDITVAESALRSTHPDRLGAAVVQAVRDARATARQPEPTPRPRDDDGDVFDGLGGYR